METEIASFERGELPLSNDTNFNFITSLVDVITAYICINYDIKKCCNYAKTYLPVQISNMSKNFMNVAERDSFDLQVPEVSCM
jgi:hypothetical protein